MLVPGVVVNIIPVCCCRNKSSSDNNWATVATVAEMTTKESAKGQAYIIWRLTDLQGTNISFFLFKDAQSGLWKEPVGAVVAVFKPQVHQNLNFASLLVTCALTGRVLSVGIADEFAAL